MKLVKLACGALHNPCRVKRPIRGGGRLKAVDFGLSITTAPYFGPKPQEKQWSRSSSQHTVELRVGLAPQHKEEGTLGQEKKMVQHQQPWQQHIERHANGSCRELILLCCSFHLFRSKCQRAERYPKRKIHVCDCGLAPALAIRTCCRR